MPPLNVSEIRVLPFIEEWYLRRQEFPPKNAIHDKFPEFNYKYSMSNDIFLKCLQNRGIKLPEADEVLTNEQMAAIAAMTNFRDVNKSPTAKLRAVGVSWTKWQGWMRNPHFRKFLQDLAAINFEDSLDLVQAGLLKAAEKGNVEAAKFFLELTGRYTPVSQETMQVKMVLAKVIEAVQIHVKDPATLQAISADFNKILSGGEAQERIAIDI